MAKYNVGDKVKVRSDLSGRHGASARMAKMWAGDVVTIESVFIDRFDGGVRYTVEDGKSIGGVSYVWNDVMFDGLADEDINAMPKLTTGMFGRESDGDLFVVVGDICVYQSGEWEHTNDSSWHYLITHLYKAKSFKEIECGCATAIWERKSEEVEEDEGEEYEADVDHAEEDVRNACVNLLKVVFGDNLDNLKEVIEK